MSPRARQLANDKPAPVVGSRAVPPQAAALAAAESSSAAGNLALASTLATALAAPPVNLPVAAPAGLATTRRIEVYVKRVRGLAEQSFASNLPLSMLATYAIYVANTELLSIGVPAVTGRIGESHTAAHFASLDWSMTVDLSKFVPDGVEHATVGEMTPTQLAEVAATVYHEARHAEQAFRQARMLAGQHHEELNPPTDDVQSADSLAEVIMRVKLAVMEREVAILRLANQLAVPVAVMRRAAEQPLIPLGSDPISRVLGAAAYGLSNLTLADALSPATALDTVVGTGKRGIAGHDLALGEAESWYEQRHLEDLVYDRKLRIRDTLSILAAEAEKAGTPRGMDVDKVREAKQPLREIIAAIDRELERLEPKPDRTVMYRLLKKLRERIFGIGASVVELRDLEQELVTPDRQTQIDELSELVVVLVGLVDLELRGPMYEELLMEKDSYELADQVRAAWEAGRAP